MNLHDTIMQEIWEQKTLSVKRIGLYPTHIRCNHNTHSYLRDHRSQYAYIDINLTDGSIKIMGMRVIIDNNLEDCKVCLDISISESIS